MSERTGPRRIGDVLGKVLARYGYSETTAQRELEEGWREVAGPLVHQRTRVGSLRRGTLEILVDNSVLLQELEGFRKAELLAALQARVQHSNVSQLRFRRK